MYTGCHQKSISRPLLRLCSWTRRAKTQNDCHLACEARNNVNLQIRHAKANFIQDNLNTHQNNSKRFWQNIKDILSNSKTSQPGKISLITLILNWMTL